MAQVLRTAYRPSSSACLSGASSASEACSGEAQHVIDIDPSSCERASETSPPRQTPGQSTLPEDSDQDPAALDALDREHVMALARGVASRNVAMIQALAKTGIRVDGSEASQSQLHVYVDLYANTGAPTLVAADLARILIAAQGDVSEAFSLAVNERNAYAAKAYFDIGADSLPAFKRCTREGRWDVAQWMLAQKITRTNDVVTVLEDSVRSRNPSLTRWLCHHAPRDARALLTRFAMQRDVIGVTTLIETREFYLDFVLVDIANMSDRADAEKIGAMKTLMAVAKVGAEVMLNAQLVWGKYEVARCMIAAGVPTTSILLTMAERRDTTAVQSMIALGADALDALAMGETSESKEVIAYAAIKVLVLDEKYLSGSDRITMLKALLVRDDAVVRGAEVLLHDELKAGNDYAVAILRAAGVLFVEDRRLAPAEPIAPAEIRDSTGLGHAAKPAKLYI